MLNQQMKNMSDLEIQKV